MVQMGNIAALRGDVAQLAERCLRKAEVGGSIPLISTTPFIAQAERQGRSAIES